MFKTTKAKVIFVAVFSIICILVTAMLLLYKNIEIEEKNEQDTQEIQEQVIEKDVSGIDLKGTYNQNDLKIEEKSITQEKVEIRYAQISGLKNKKIEEKINKEIERAALNCYQKQVKDLDKVINVYVSMWNTANFANTIAFELSYIAKTDDYSDDYYQGLQTLNYDLNTGNRITIDQVFTSDAPIENILRKSIYYDLISRKAEDNLAGDLVVPDYGNIEDEIIRIINLYKRGKITEFSYNPMEIILFYDEDEAVFIKMKDFAEYIAIYNDSHKIPSISEYEYWISTSVIDKNKINYRLDGVEEIFNNQLLFEL